MKDNSVAVLRYITQVGWILAMLLNHNINSTLVKFHLRQSLGVFILYFALFFAANVTMRLPVIGFVGAELFGIINFLVIVYLIMGAWYAFKKRQTLLPIMGQWAQDQLSIIIK